MKSEDLMCRRDCPNRTATCKFDGSCRQYKDYRKLLEKEAEAIRKKKHDEWDADRYTMGIKNRIAKRKGRI